MSNLLSTKIQVQRYTTYTIKMSHLIICNFFKIYFILFNFTILYWFFHISKWIHHRYTCVPHPEPSSLIPPHTIPLGHPSATATAKSLQSCPTLCDPRDSSPPGSPIPGILQARTPEWVTISFSSAWKWKVKVKSLSRVHLLATPWTATHQAPPSMGFSRQEYWSGVPLPSPHPNAPAPTKED